MEVMGGFSTSKRSRNTLPRNNLRVVAACNKVVKYVGPKFLAGGIWNVFAYSSTTKSLVNKWMLRLDSPYSKGAEITFQGLLTIGGDSL
jgi:hypothetical protein